MFKNKNKNLQLLVAVVVILVVAVVINSVKQGEPYSAKLNPIVKKSNMPYPITPLPDGGRYERNGEHTDLLKNYNLSNRDTEYSFSSGETIDDILDDGYYEILEGFEIAFPEPLTTISGDRVPLIGRIRVGPTHYISSRDAEVNIEEWWVEVVYGGQRFVNIILRDESGNYYVPGGEHYQQSWGNEFQNVILGYIDTTILNNETADLKIIAVDDIGNHITAVSTRIRINNN